MNSPERIISCDNVVSLHIPGSPISCPNDEPAPFNKNQPSPNSIHGSPCADATSTTISSELSLRTLGTGGHSVTTNTPLADEFQERRDTSEEKPYQNNEEQYVIHATNRNDTTASAQVHERILLRDLVEDSNSSFSAQHADHYQEPLLLRTRGDNAMQQETVNTEHQQPTLPIFTHGLQSQNQPLLVNHDTPQPNKNMVLIPTVPSRSNKLCAAVDNYYQPTELERPSNVSYGKNPVDLLPSTTTNAYTSQYSEHYQSSRTNPCVRRSQEYDLQRIDLAIERREFKLQQEYEDLKDLLERRWQGARRPGMISTNMRHNGQKRHIDADDSTFVRQSQRRRLDDIHEEYLPKELNQNVHLQSGSFVTLPYQQRNASYYSRTVPTHMIVPLQATEYFSSLTKPKRVWKSVEERIEELKEYKAIHGDCNVPRRSRNYSTLGVWCKNIRASYSQLQEGKRPKIHITESHIKALNEIGFLWKSIKET